MVLGVSDCEVSDCRKVINKTIRPVCLFYLQYTGIISLIL